MGFNIGEFVQSEKYKLIMGYVYGWGAAVVLAGALFKIQHWPGASIMLTAGMGTEIVIFFLSAFDPPHKEVEWHKVWPVLAHDHDDAEDEHMDDEETTSEMPQKQSALFTEIPISLGKTTTRLLSETNEENIISPSPTVCFFNV
jgi:gliding motility-associated protein GldL